MRVFVLSGIALTAGACPHHGGHFDLAIDPLPGLACREVRVGVNQIDVETSEVSCNFSVAWSLQDGGVAEVSLPPPSKSEALVGQRYKDAAVSRRRARISAPGTRDEHWQIDVEDSPVSLDALSPSEAAKFDLHTHRYVAFVIRDTTRSGVVFPFPVAPDQRAQDLFKADPNYCSEFASHTKIYVADPATAPQDRIYTPESAIGGYPLYCSHTDANVFAFDLANRVENDFDVVVEAPLRVPRIFRLHMEPTANYTVVDITLLPQAE